ncbi:MAG: hypothetical protein U0359_30195 [Byssovorax sp.]
MRYILVMEPAASVIDAAEPSADEEDRARVLHALAQGLADDAAGRTMDTRALKESLERELGSIAWP